jgi:hypothetical protein
MPAMHRLVVRCEEKISVRGDPKLWIEGAEQGGMARCGNPDAIAKEQRRLSHGSPI